MIRSFQSPLRALVAIGLLFCMPELGQAAPELAWTIYLGDSGWDEGYDIAVGRQGDLFITGYTSSSGWTSGDISTTYFGGGDIYVARFTPEGSHVWSLYLGGPKSDSGNAIAVDSSGNLLVAGSTYSPGWVSGGFNTSLNMGDNNTNADAFIYKMTPSGQHIWSTYLGGINWEGIRDLVVDNSGNVYVVGGSLSPGWVSGGFDTSYPTNRYGADFIAEITHDGRHVWSAYYNDEEHLLQRCESIAVDHQGFCLVAGGAYGWEGGTDADFSRDAFVLKLTPNGQLFWKKWPVGGPDYAETEGIRAIALDGKDNIHVAGYTRTAGWVSGGYNTQLTTSTLEDGFVAKLDPEGNPLWSTYTGGIAVNCLALDIAGNISAGRGSFLRLSSTGQYLWGRQIGVNVNDSSRYDEIRAMAADPAGNLYLTGVWNFVLGYNIVNKDGFLSQITVDGSLRVMAEPPAAAAAGAQWRRAGTGAWFASGAMESDLTSGTHTVEFKPAYGWAPPPNQIINIVKGQTTETSGTYTKQNTIAPGDWMKY